MARKSGLLLSRSYMLAVSDFESVSQRLLIVVKVWEDDKSLALAHARAEERDVVTENDSCFAFFAPQLCYVFKDENGKPFPLFENSELGEVHLCQRYLSPALLAHEAFHASIYFARCVGIPNFRGYSKRVRANEEGMATFHANIIAKLEQAVRVWR